MIDKPLLSFLTDEDVFHCENDSPVDMKIYLSSIRLEYQGQIDSDNKEKSRYQNALLMINSFSRYPEHTATEINIFEIVSNALSGYTQNTVDAVGYWVNKCIERDEIISTLTARIAELELLYQLARGRIELGDSKIAELQSRIARLEKAGEALMYYADYNDEDNIWRCIKCGSLWKHINDEKHYDDCPVTEWMEAKK